MAPWEANTRQGIDMDQVVREVLARLDARPVDQPSAPPASTGELVVPASLVTLAELDGRLDRVGRVVVPAGAVVTPAARDRLRQANISLDYAPATRAAAQAVPLVWGAAATAYSPAALIRALGQEEGVVAERLARTGLVSVVEEMCDQVSRGGKLGLLLTGQTDAALCLANRQPGVRAALGVHLRGVAAAVSAVGANLLVIEPEGRSLFELKQMAKEFARGGPRRCPDSYSKWLA